MSSALEPDWTPREMEGQEEGAPKEAKATYDVVRIARASRSLTVPRGHAGPLGTL
jgi:hypothetical protein